MNILTVQRNARPMRTNMPHPGTPSHRDRPSHPTPSSQLPQQPHPHPNPSRPNPAQPNPTQPDSSQPDPAQPDPAIDALYAELHALARSLIAAEPAGITLQTTALVNEAFLRLNGSPHTDPRWADTRHYLATATLAMRRILVEAARRRRALKRGGNQRRLHLNPDELHAPATLDPDFLDLHAALTGLESLDPDLAEVVSLRFFAGLSIDQVAAVVGRSPRSIDRDWRTARAFLVRQLQLAAG